MSIKISIQSGDKSVNMDVESSTTVNDILDRAITYWGKKRGAYVLLKESTLLPGGANVSQLTISEGEVLELVRSPEGG